MKLFEQYKLRNGETITFDGLSILDNEYGKPVDIYSSSEYHGSWNKRGQYLTNVYFLNNEPSEMDVVK